MQHVGERAGRLGQHEIAVVTHALTGYDATALYRVEMLSLPCRAVLTGAVFQERLNMIHSILKYI